MIQKIIGTVGTKMFPYWCPACPRRFRTEKKFHNHYLNCEYRLMAERKKEEALRAIAPVNRSQRRRMAKKSGRIKDWKDLNAS